MPVIIAIRTSSSVCASTVPDSDHAPSTPGAVTAVTRTAIAIDATNAADARTTPAASFEVSTRDRCGTCANVISVVRCDHSEVTSRIPTTGGKAYEGHAEATKMLCSV